MVKYGTLPPKALSARLSKEADPLANMMRICFFICTVECCERISFYTFSGTQAFFLERVGFPLEQASIINASMGTLCFLWTLLTGWLADVVLGRYTTILISAALYIAASATIATAARPEVSSARLYMLGTMGLVPLATAGVKVTISIFGADQFQDDDATPRAAAKAQARFFSWFFVAVNAGAFVAFCVLVDLGNDGGFGVPPAYGYFVAYVISGACMVGALGLFIAGRRTYVIVAPLQRSSLSRFMLPLLSAAANGSITAAFVLAGLVSIVFGLVLSVMQGILAAGVLARFSAMTTLMGIFSVLLFCDRPDWLSRSELPSGDAKGMLRLLPLFVTGEIGGLMAQTVAGVWFQTQACQMDVRMWWRAVDKPQQLSGAFFNVVDCIGIIVGTPLVLHCINPALRRLTGWRLDYSGKIFLGVFFGAAAMLSAGVLEYFRRAAPSTGVVSHCAPPGVEMKAISGFWICIPYALTAISEIYVYPTLLFVAYEKSPVSMRMFSTTVFYFMLSMISSINAVITEYLRKYVTDKLDDGHLEYIYLASTAVSIVFALLFWRAEGNYNATDALNEGPPKSLA